MENGETAYYVVNVPRGLTFVLPPTEKGSLHVPVVRHVPFWSETPSGVRDGGESSWLHVVELPRGTEREFKADLMVKNPRFLPFANYVGLSLLCPRRVAAYLFPKFNSLVGGIELQEFSVLEEVPLEELLPFLVGEARLSSFPKEVLDKQLRSRLLEQEGKDKSVREGTLYCNFNCLEQEGLDKYVRGGFFTDRKLHPAFFYSGFLLSSNRGERVYLSPFDVDTSPAPISVAPSQFKNLSSELSHLLGF